MAADLVFNELIDFMRKVPAIDNSIATGFYDDKNWWIKFSIDINNNLAWNVVQEFGHILNYISIEERLPTVFYPVSAPPYMNGGPQEFLYWVIESKQPDFLPSQLKEWLEGRLPNPVDDINEWEFDE